MSGAVQALAFTAGETVPGLRLEADGALAEVALHGAHLLRWVPAGETASRLYLSGRARCDGGAAIRGGIPVIFPQFAGEGPLPKHGFARGVAWAPCEAGPAQARLQLGPRDAQDARWPHPYAAELRVQLSARALEVTLAVTNTGATALRFTAALHSYLAVDALAQLRLHGLQHLHYRDSAAGGVLREESEPAVVFAGEVDRIYLDAPPELVLAEPGRRLRIGSSGFADCVVWNPGAAKAAALPDLDAGGEQHFVCVEAAAVGRPVVLEPGASWEGRQRLTAE